MENIRENIENIRKRIADAAVRAGSCLLYTSDAADE